MPYFRFHLCKTQAVHYNEYTTKQYLFRTGYIRTLSGVEAVHSGPVEVCPNAQGIDRFDSAQRPNREILNRN